MNNRLLVIFHISVKNICDLNTDNRNVINQPLWCKALYDYDAEMSCDLSFRMGKLSLHTFYLNATCSTI